uniref:Uncharacterized protein n=1 Tax=Pararge aegeria TaxID=116150 RepID=S4NVG1_9NEOP
MPIFCLEGTQIIRGRKHSWKTFHILALGIRYVKKGVKQQTWGAHNISLKLALQLNTPLFTPREKITFDEDFLLSLALHSHW